MEYTPPGPVARAFMKSDAFIRGIRGPLGSGKTTACIMDMWRTACMQVPNKKNPDDAKEIAIRRYRGVLTRNTYGELQSTTLNSFLMWFPDSLGRLTYGAPIEYMLSKLLPDGSRLEAEFMFLALDRPEHIKKLLSLEVTQGYMNEAREQPKAILDALTGRVGRYPAKKDGGPVRSGVIMDTNSPDPSHWWPKMSDLADEQTREQTRKLEEQLRAMDALRPGVRLMEFFTQPSAELPDGSMNPNAENIENLEKGYYLKTKAGKTDDWIKVYIRNEYHFVMDGKAVYENYRDNLHVQEHAYNPNWPLHIGMDFGLTPAAVFGQVTPMGQKRILSELISQRMGAKNFAREIRAHLAHHYGAAPILGTITGDPAGAAEAQTDEQTVFQMLASEGVVAQPASTNDFEIRRTAVNEPMGQLIDGGPALVITPRCVELRKACAGGYHLRRIQVSGEARYDTKPYKNMSSHIAEALQYYCLGVGVGKEVVLKPQKMRGQRPAGYNTNYDPFNYGG